VTTGRRPRILRIEVDTVIDRPVSDVWEFVIDLKNSPRWTRSGSELRETTTGALGVGTTIESVRPILGREIRSQAIVVTEYDPGHVLSIEATVPLIGRAPGGFLFEGVGAATRLARWGEIDLGRAERLLGPVVVRLLRGGWRAELRNLKGLLEDARRPSGHVP
jgi:uncharacterized protein YndB with AHSA1/START domain